MFYSLLVNLAVFLILNEYPFLQIYWTDGGRNSIEVAELDGKNRKVLVWTGLGKRYE